MDALKNIGGGGGGGGARQPPESAPRSRSRIPEGGPERGGDQAPEDLREDGTVRALAVRLEALQREAAALPPGDPGLADLGRRLAEAQAAMEKQMGSTPTRSATSPEQVLQLLKGQGRP